MHIVLDLRMVGPQLHGIGRYALELSRRLPFLAPESQFDLIVCPGLDKSLLGTIPENVRLLEARSGFLSPAEQAELPLLLRRLKPDLYHSPSFSVPLGYRGPLALTIHDANHLAFPKNYGRLHGLYYRHIVNPGASRARLLLTVSHFARSEIEDRLGLPLGRIQVIYNGVGAAFRPFELSEITKFRRRQGLPDNYILYVGNTKPHKNLIQLLQAFKSLDPKLGLWLVLCAGHRAAKMVNSAGLRSKRVLILDSIADQDLPLLYASSRLFAFPSLYEGFGLPPLEAMACGTPVVATRATALPEILGNSAAFVEPGDSRALADAITRIVSDADFARELHEAGLVRASQFSWDRTAQSVLNAYRRAAEPFHRRASSSENPIPGPRGASLKVLFCVRQNLTTLSGGDATQILRTKNALEARGVEVVLWSEPRSPAHGSFDLAHLFHLTRLDTFVQARALVRDAMPFVLSTIYWPTAEFERRGYVGALKILHAALSTGPADLAKNSVRAILADGDWRWAMLPETFLALEQRIEFLVRHALCLLPNSDAEGEVLKEFGASRIRPIVNASDPSPELKPTSIAGLPSNYLLCAGRIEPRKNQLALVEALKGFKIPLVIVGNAGPMHDGYYDRVRSAADRWTMLLPAQRRQELFSLYAGAEAHIAPAWYETPGLVSLEAAAAGTRVVTTDRGSTKEYFKDDASYLDPGDRSSIRRAVENALASPKNSKLRDRVLTEFTWDRAGEQTLEAYRAVLAEP